MMRGAAAEAGVHRLVQTYEPTSFRAGASISGATLAVFHRRVGFPGLSASDCEHAVERQDDRSRRGERGNESIAGREAFGLEVGTLFPPGSLAAC